MQIRPEPNLTNTIRLRYFSTPRAGYESVQDEKPDILIGESMKRPSFGRSPGVIRPITVRSLDLRRYVVASPDLSRRSRSVGGGRGGA